MKNLRTYRTFSEKITFSSENVAKSLHVKIAILKEFTRRKFLINEKSIL